MREMLRCSECGLQAEVVWGDKDMPEERYVWWLESDKSELIYEPIICPKDGTKMKVVRNCEACKGTGNAITDEMEDPSICHACLGSTEILEEQP